MDDDARVPPPPTPPVSPPTSGRANRLEVVGILVTAHDRPNALALVFLANLASESGRWAIRRDDIARVRREFRGRGIRVLGLFHSHPLTEARAALPSVHALVAGNAAPLTTASGSAGLQACQRPPGSPN
jgi:hypothetical protein